MIHILRLCCKYLLQLAGWIVESCSCKFLPESIAHETHCIPIPGGASDDLFNHQQSTRIQPRRQFYHESDSLKSADAVEKSLHQASYAGNLRKRNEVIRRLLETDDICNSFMSCGSTVSTAVYSSEFEDAESSTRIDSCHSSEGSSDSASYGIQSCEISKVLQSVITAIEILEKSPESSEAAEVSILTDDESKASGRDVESFPESLATDVRGSSLHNVDESFSMDAEDIGLSLHNASDCSDSNVAENREGTVVNEFVPMESSEAMVGNVADADSLHVITENNDATLQIQTESFPELTEPSLDNAINVAEADSVHSIAENNDARLQNQTESFTELAEPSLDDAAALFSRTESGKSTTERSADVSASPQSSSFITFKEINNKYSYMPRLVAADFGMKESANNWDVNWTHDFVSFRTCRKLKRHQRINHFPGSICLSNKDLLGRNLNVMYDCFPKDYDIFPKTWFIPGDMPDIERYARNNKRASFIVKPHDGGAGSGIKITSSLREINSRRKTVCQLYIQRPFLIDGYKFDFRVYVLMTSIEPLRIFVHKEGIARFATVKYEKPSAGNTSQKFMHLTNTCVNKNNPAYIRDESKGSTRRITNVLQWFLDNNIDAGKVQDSMDDTIIKTIIVCLPTLQRYYRLSFPYHTTSISCFELMGFDIMLDHKLKVYLLEVNVAPSFANETGTSHVASIKREVVSDTFAILNLMESVSERNKQKAGKRANKMADKVKDRLITNRRIRWENSHMGNFRKIYPPGALRKGYYQKFIDKATSRLGTNFYLNSRDIELTAEQRKWLF